MNAAVLQWSAFLPLGIVSVPMSLRIICFR